MLADKLPNQRQPDAGSLIGAAALAFDAVKPLENAWQLSLGNSNTGIADGQRNIQRIATSICPCKVNLNALERRLRTIFSHISRST